MWNLVVFALIGLLAGTAARLLYPGRQAMQVLGTLVLGMVGSLAGGMISWIYWPMVAGQFQTGNLVMSMVGGVSVILLWAGATYVRRLSGPRRISP